MPQAMTGLIVICTRICQQEICERHGQVAHYSRYLLWEAKRQGRGKCGAMDLAGRVGFSPGGCLFVFLTDGFTSFSLAFAEGIWSCMQI